MSIQTLDLKAPGPQHGHTWIITGTDLLSIGYMDSVLYSPGFSPVYLIIKAYAQCGYDSSALDNITMFAHKYCGDPVMLETACDPYVQDTSLCTTCFQIFKTALQDTVIVGDSASFAITLYGNNSSSQTVLLTEILPSDFTLDPLDTIPYIVTIPAQGDTTIYVWGYFSTPGPSSDTIHRNTVMVESADSVYLRQDSMAVIEPCFNQANVNIAAGDSVSVTGIFDYTGDSIFVMGDWFIDASLTLTNCKVYTGTNAHIFVLTDDLLILDSSTTIMGCLTMWRGIKLEYGSAMQMKNNSIVADGAPGVYVTGEANSFLIQNS